MPHSRNDLLPTQSGRSRGPHSMPVETGLDRPAPYPSGGAPAGEASTRGIGPLDPLAARRDHDFFLRAVSDTGCGPHGATRSDRRLRKAVCDALTKDSDLDASQIEVSVGNGRVTLSGTLEQRWQKHHAGNLAARCRGVCEVDNRIRVHKRDATGDASLATVSLHGPHGKALGGTA